MTPEDILTKAADIIATEGHTKNGCYYQPGEGYCAIGAMAEAAGMIHKGVDFDEVFWSADDCVDAGQRLAAILGLDHPWLITVWNDEEASAEDVILALKKAAHHDS